MLRYTFHGVRMVDGGLVEMARLYRLGRHTLSWHVVLPGALPDILLGVRYGLGIMWLTLIVAEVVALADRVLVLRKGKMALDMPVTAPRPRRSANRRIANRHSECVAGLIAQLASRHRYFCDQKT